MATKQIRITIDEKVLAALDRDRLTTTRSNYINDLLFYATATDEQLKGIVNFEYK
jgi:hypothetical protein